MANPPQDRAVALLGSLAAGEAVFIQGPPGTGKTTVIVEAIKRRLAANPDERILVTSHSNLAVDNALERLAGTPGMRAVRVARAERVHPTVERFRCDDEDDPRLLEANCYFATCATAATSAITDMNFDIVILDEANKARVDEALPALRLGSALALVGDHKQLPPVEDDALYGIVESDEALETLVNRSLFEQAWEGGLPESARCLLTIQHRMHPDIAAYVSAASYDGQLQDAPEVQAYSYITRTPFPVALHFVDTEGMRGGPRAPRARRRAAQRGRGARRRAGGAPARRARPARDEHGGDRHVRRAGGAAPPGAGAPPLQAPGEDRHRRLLRGPRGGHGGHLAGALQRARPHRLPARAQPPQRRHLARQAPGRLHRRQRHPARRRGVDVRRARRGRPLHRRLAQRARHRQPGQAAAPPPRRRPAAAPRVGEDGQPLPAVEGEEGAARRRRRRRRRGPAQAAGVAAHGRRGGPARCRRGAAAARPRRRAAPPPPPPPPSRSRGRRAPAAPGRAGRRSAAPASTARLLPGSLHFAPGGETQSFRPRRRRRRRGGGGGGQGAPGQPRRGRARRPPSCPRPPPAERMAGQITVFIRAGDAQCEALLRYLDQRGLAYTTRDVTADPRRARSSSAASAASPCRR